MIKNNTVLKIFFFTLKLKKEFLESNNTKIIYFEIKFLQLILIKINNNNVIRKKVMHLQTIHQSNNEQCS